MDKKYCDEFSIAFMCKILNVSRSGYYEWTNKLVNNRAKEDKELIAMIRTIFWEGEGRNAYGSKHIKACLPGKM